MVLKFEEYVKSKDIIKESYQSGKHYYEYYGVSPADFY